MSLDALMVEVEDLAAAGDYDAALAMLEALRRQVTDAAARASVQVSIGAITAQAGRLDEALPLLEVAEALARTAADEELALEARVTHASVLGALGRYDEAVPSLRRSVKRLRELDADPELVAHATAELAAFQNLVGPKNAATWASLLER